METVEHGTSPTSNIDALSMWKLAEPNVMVGQFALVIFIPDSPDSYLRPDTVHSEWDFVYVCSRKYWYSKKKLIERNNKV
jgi:hypothetical protein